MSAPRFQPSPESFLVEEIPAYEPSGSGEHLYLWIEKRNLTTLDAVGVLARRLGVAARDVGYAGMKDRAATTRQWLSFPRIDPEAALAVIDDGLRVLRAVAHGNKLRVGHVAGNRFETTLTGLDEAGELARRLRANLAQLVARGFPNRFGAQRFGAAADNARKGIAILRGELRERDHRRRRMLVSAAQSAVFNEVLRLRAADDSLHRVLLGDVLQKTPAGGVFVSDDPEVDQGRLAAGEVVITGPMPGSWAREPAAGSPARALEDQALANLGARREDFARGGKDLPGTRRQLVARVADARVLAADLAALQLGFRLPAGSYATVFLESLGVEVGEPPRDGAGGRAGLPAGATGTDSVLTTNGDAAD